MVSFKLASTGCRSDYLICPTACSGSPFSYPFQNLQAPFAALLFLLWILYRERRHLEKVIFKLSDHIAPPWLFQGLAQGEEVAAPPTTLSSLFYWGLWLLYFSPFCFSFLPHNVQEQNYSDQPSQFAWDCRFSLDVGFLGFKAGKFPANWEAEELEPMGEMSLVLPMVTLLFNSNLVSDS